MAHGRDRVIINRNIGCCGIVEAQGLSDSGGTSTQLLHDFCARAFHNDKQPGSVGEEAQIRQSGAFAFVLFSEADEEPRCEDPDCSCQENDTDSDYATQFRNLISSLNLGPVVDIAGKENPNTGNFIRPFIWTVNWPATRAWWMEAGVEWRAKERKSYKDYLKSVEKKGR